MKVTRGKCQHPDLIDVGDIFDVEDYGDCAVIRIDDADTGLFTVLSASGDEITISIYFAGQEPTHEAPTTLQ